MSELSCEDVMIAKMAEADGEAVGRLPEATLHVERCEQCRTEFSRLQEVDAIFMRQTRLEQEVHLWPVIENRIAQKPLGKVGWFPFAALVIILAGYKLFELLPDGVPGLAFRLVPVAIVAILFLLIKENPFKVNSELTFER